MHEYLYLHQHILKKSPSFLVSFWHLGFSGTDCFLSTCVYKVVQLGFKSVAHYLIKTRLSEKGLEDSGGENIVAEGSPETSTHTTLNRSTRTSTRRALRLRG